MANRTGRALSTGTPAEDSVFVHWDASPATTDAEKATLAELRTALAVAPLASPTFTGIVKFAGVKGTASGKAAAYTIAAADSGTLIVCTAALTLTFPAITTLAPNANDFFAVDVHNDSSGNVILLGATSTTLAAGEIATVYARNGGKMIVAKGAPVTVIR